MSGHRAIKRSFLETGDDSSDHTKESTGYSDRIFGCKGEEIVIAKGSKIIA
jgi:hypothetical protein